MNEAAIKHGKPKRRKTLVLIAGPLVIVLAGLAFYLFTGRFVSTGDAYVKADKTSITTEVSGRVVQIYVHDNSRVSAGDSLFEIDPEPFRIAERRAEASLKYRELVFNRYNDLAERRAVSQEKRDEAELNLSVAREECAAARQAATSGYGNNSYMMMWITLIVIPLLLILSNPHKAMANALASENVLE